MSSDQQTLNGDLLPRHIREREHLTEVKPPGSPSALKAHPERKEAWCIECGNHITCGSKEYGHELCCEFSVWGEDE